MPAGTIKTKAQLTSDIDTTIPVAGGGNVTNAELNVILNDMVASYENVIQAMTTAARDALTPAQGDKIFNTTNSRMEFYNGTAWIACSQKPTVAVDCSANPNYVEASVGDQYIVSVAGKIGGASGKSVYVGDLVYCITKNAGGTEASVGTSWQVCHSQSLTDSPTFLATLNLSSAQILALNSTPQTLVAAPGAGKIIMPLRYVWQYTFVTAAYATNTSLRAMYSAMNSDTLVNLAAVASALGFYDATANTTPVDNTALKISVSGGDPTAGDSTVKIQVYYKIHTL